MPTRRAFLGYAATPALAWQSPAGSRIRIGLIGAGGRGRYLLSELAKPAAANFSVTAVCDVWKPNLESAAAAIEKQYGARPATTTRYRDILENRAIDAVIISAPDHTHSRMLKEAVEAGKDAYCEKPMGTDVWEARAAYHAVKASRQIVQIGTQRRSEPGLIAAGAMIREGVIGRITRIDMQVNFQEARWRRDYHMVKEEDIDWEAFRFGRDIGPFDPRKFREWQLFHPFTNGIPGLWMSHFIDLVAWYLDDPYPASAVAEGGVFLWKDGRETSDVFHALLRYPKDCLVSFAMSLTNAAGDRNLWFGVKGTFDGQAVSFLPDGSRAPDRLTARIDVKGDPVESHTDNWLRCIRTRQTPRADVQAGFSHAVAGCMAAQALRDGRRVRFDSEALAIV